MNIFKTVVIASIINPNVRPNFPELISVNLGAKNIINNANRTSNVAIKFLAKEYFFGTNWALIPSISRIPLLFFILIVSF